MDRRCRRFASNCTLVIATCWCLSSQGQSQQPNQWRGLTLHESTIEDAVAKLGEPQKVKQNQKFRTVLSKFVDGSARYTKLEFKRLPQMKGANLYFLEDKLEIVELTLEEKINPNRLEEVYGTRFFPKAGALDRMSGDWERDQGKLYPTTYPVVYNLFGRAENSYIVARVQRGAFSQLGATMAGGDSGVDFPGKVDFIQLISTSLSDDRGLGAIQ